MRKHLQKFGPLYAGFFGCAGVIGIIAAYGLSVAHSYLAPAAFIGSVAVIVAGMVAGLSDWE